jgi:hypothetical protein
VTELIMAIQCANDGQYLVPGKRVLLKRYQGLTASPAGTIAQHNYWQLLNSKGVLVEGLPNYDCLLEPGLAQLILVQFEWDFASLGLMAQAPALAPNSLWVALSDLKFVCRY